MLNARINNAVVRRFTQNPVAMTGFGIIALMAVVAVAGYLLIPDKTPNANRQILELAAKSPGFSTTVMNFRRNEPSVKQGFFRTILYGQKSDYDFYPLLDYDFKDTQVIIREYTEYPEEDSFYRE